MSGSIITYYDIKEIDFYQTSINLDACFLLAYLDENDDRGDKVAEIIEQWATNGVSVVGISNHVVGEVIHNIFKSRIREVLKFAHKRKKAQQLRRPYNLSASEIAIIGDSVVADNLRSLVDSRVLDRLQSSNELAYSIEKLLKDYKASFPLQTEGLNMYYAESVSRYLDLINGLEDELGIQITNPSSDHVVLQHALASTSFEQLGIYDALHIAVARHHQFDYFATLDGDFVSDYINVSGVSVTKIIKVA